MDKEKLLELVVKDAEMVAAGQYPPLQQNGFWTDHFTYHLDLVTNFLAVYPDEKEAMLYDSEPVPFFMSPGRCVKRVEKNMLTTKGTIRQYDAVAESPAKVAAISALYNDPTYVGECPAEGCTYLTAGAGGAWQKTVGGETMTVSIIAKLIILAANKFAIMDPLGMGLEMEAGKPGWNDAMNGLPGLFGSEMPSAYELQQIIKFVGTAVDEINRPVQLPEEVSVLLSAIATQLDRLKTDADASDFDYWDKVHDALEEYRIATDATFTGNFAAWEPPTLGRATGIFGAMLARMDQGIERANAFSQKNGEVVPALDKASGGGVSPTYFKYTVTKYALTGSTSKRGLPTVLVQGFEPEVLPLFLEGPVRRLKTVTSMDEKQSVYASVLGSDLRDTKLQMYKMSASLADEPFEIGRMKAFDSGWLENESVWLHMSYKWYLELLRAGYTSSSPLALSNLRIPSLAF